MDDRDAEAYVELIQKMQKLYFINQAANSRKLNGAVWL